MFPKSEFIPKKALFRLKSSCLSPKTQTHFNQDKLKINTTLSFHQKPFSKPSKIHNAHQPNQQTPLSSAAKKQTSTRKRNFHNDFARKLRFFAGFSKFSAFGFDFAL